MRKQNSSDYHHKMRNKESLGQYKFLTTCYVNGCVAKKKKQVQERQDKEKGRREKASEDKTGLER